MNTCWISVSYFCFTNIEKVLVVLACIEDSPLYLVDKTSNVPTAMQLPEYIFFQTQHVETSNQHERNR